MEEAQPHTRPSSRPAKPPARKAAPPDPVAGFGPPASAPPVWEVSPGAPQSEPEVCRRRADAARALAATTQDPLAREALEVVAVNWENLGVHLAERPRRTSYVETPRKAEARRAALGIDD